MYTRKRAYFGFADVFAKAMEDPVQQQAFANTFGGGEPARKEIAERRFVPGVFAEAFKKAMEDPVQQQAFANTFGGGEPARKEIAERNARLQAKLLTKPKGDE